MNGELGPGAEFDLIRALLEEWGERAEGIGDDAAVLPQLGANERLAASVDAFVEGRHFRRDWLSNEEIGWRATMAALSDLAATGARPLGLLVAVAVPDEWRPRMRDIARGIGMAAHYVGTVVRGGNVTAANTFSITTTVLGAVTRPLSRAGAQVGDSVWVSGSLGGPITALNALRNGDMPDESMHERFARPVARIGAGCWLSAHGATAAIDVSDGLLADLRHLALASNVCVDIDPARVPCMPGVSVQDALSSGEEYELAFTTRPDHDVSALAHDAGVRATKIGTVEPGTAGVSLRGARVEFASGHDHFST